MVRAQQNALNERLTHEDTEAQGGAGTCPAPRSAAVTLAHQDEWGGGGRPAQSWPRGAGQRLGGRNFAARAEGHVRKSGDAEGSAEAWTPG